MFFLPYLVIKIRLMLNYQTERGCVFFFHVTNEDPLELVRIPFLPLNQSFLHSLMECFIFWEADDCEALLRFVADHQFVGHFGSLCVVLKVCNFKLLNCNFKGGRLFSAFIISVIFMIRCI